MRRAARLGEKGSGRGGVTDAMVTALGPDYALGARRSVSPTCTSRSCGPPESPPGRWHTRGSLSDKPTASDSTSTPGSPSRADD